jgi:hypothetical protein
VVILDPRYALAMIDKAPPEKPPVLIGFILCAFSGFLVGVIVGYFL